MKVSVQGRIFFFLCPCPLGYAEAMKPTSQMEILRKMITYLFIYLSINFILLSFALFLFAILQYLCRKGVKLYLKHLSSKLGSTVLTIHIVTESVGKPACR